MREIASNWVFMKMVDFSFLLQYNTRTTLLPKSSCHD
uniref:Uncharacterized protein n=1 Tax=Rhizophora mucronata TaxID=61149 RepID=A0A2P2P4U5_RHIMU